MHYSCFASKDELIRQETINCPERGLLLACIRDELQMNVAAHKTLYEDSIAFGTSETMMAEEGKAHMEKRVKDMNYLISCFIQKEQVIKKIQLILKK